METIIGRDYEGPGDLARIAGLISDAWLTARPHVPFTIVTLEWLMANQPADTDWSTRIRLWEHGRRRWWPSPGTGRPATPTASSAPTTTTTRSGTRSTPGNGTWRRPRSRRSGAAEPIRDRGPDA